MKAVSLLVAAVAALLLSLGCAPTATGPGGTSAVVHISEGPDDADEALMGLHLAAVFAKQGPVLVYFDLDGVLLVVKGSPDPALPSYESKSALLRQLRERGAKLVACRRCLKAAGKSPSDLLPGVEIATAEHFTGLPGQRILTFDY